MGDHRVSIEIKFSAHGIERSCDMWINWPAEHDAVDHRVIEFLRSAWNDAFDEWLRKEAEYLRDANKAFTERTEREELARLKAKYEASGQGAV